MAALFRYEDEHHLFAVIAGCPLRSAGRSSDASACARCRYNAAWPGKAAPGCHVVVPAEVWAAADAELLRRNAPLHAVLTRLRGAGPTCELDDTHAWEKLAHAFNALAHGADSATAAACREVASIVNAFVQSARRTHRPIRMAE